ncbi:uncharacterized protein LOC133515122 [Syngnathoides biaculeatus]|uniref:uncharacterized protein LOC133515122 n=1 Tax=Syngnathoides biaculeatus TaxID=300417 RepID=UPI002ADD7C9C|nr:uncharacterized protein LOC133515122 [Syngnathoides biaculeatus]
MASINKANYCSMKSQQCSDYVRNLPFEVRKRYFEKLGYRDGTCILPDPYNLKNGWVDDPSLWPDITFTDIYFYLVDAPGQFTHASLKAYKSLKAYEYVESGQMHPVFYYNVEQSPYCFLKTKVIPSQRPRDKPHQPWTCLNKSEGTVYCTHCTCLEGLGEVCSHVAALLFKVDATVRAGLTSTASTGEACKWNASYRKELNPIPISDINIMGSRKTDISTTSARGKALLPDRSTLQSLRDVCPNAVFFKTIPSLDDEETDTAEEEEETRSLPPTITSLISEDDITEDNITSVCEQQWNSYKCTEDQIINLEIVTKDQAVSPIWYEHRKGRITGSKAHDILVMKATSDPKNNIMKVMGYNSRDISKKAAVAWGTDNKARARHLYLKQAARSHFNFDSTTIGLLVCQIRPYMAVSCDGIVSCTCCGKGCVEVKCPDKHRNSNIANASKDNLFCLDKDLHLKKEHRYYTQVQFQMYVQKVSYCDLVVYTNLDMAIVRIPRDDKFISTLLSKCDTFFCDHVLPEVVSRKLENSRPELRDFIPDKELVENVWCYCQEEAHGRMIMCDGADCPYTWFHYGCVDIRRKPKGSWFCPSCVMG